MNRAEFMSCLERLLADLPYEERQEALNFYDNYFEDAGPEREWEVILELGSPREVADEILRGSQGSGSPYDKPDYESNYGDYGGDVHYEPVRESFFKKHPVWSGILAIPALIIGLPLVIAAAAVIFSLVCGIAAVLFGLAVAAVAVMAALFFSGIVFLGLAAVKFFVVPSVGVMMFGAALLCVGVGVFCIYLVSGSFRLIGSVFGWLGGLFRRKKA